LRNHPRFGWGVENGFFFFFLVKKKCYNLVGKRHIDRLRNALRASTIYSREAILNEIIANTQRLLFCKWILNDEIIDDIQKVLFEGFLEPPPSSVNGSPTPTTTTAAPATPQTNNAGSNTNLFNPTTTTATPVNPASAEVKIDSHRVLCLEFFIIFINRGGNFRRVIINSNFIQSFLRLTVGSYSSQLLFNALIAFSIYLLRTSSSVEDLIELSVHGYPKVLIEMTMAGSFDIGSENGKQILRLLERMLIISICQKSSPLFTGNKQYIKYSQPIYNLFSKLDSLDLGNTPAEGDQSLFSQIDLRVLISLFSVGLQTNPQTTQTVRGIVKFFSEVLASSLANPPVNASSTAHTSSSISFYPLTTLSKILIGLAVLAYEERYIYILQQDNIPTLVMNIFKHYLTVIPIATNDYSVVYSLIRPGTVIYSLLMFIRYYCNACSATDKSKLIDEKVFVCLVRLLHLVGFGTGVPDDDVVIGSSSSPLTSVNGSSSSSSGGTSTSGPNELVSSIHSSPLSPRVSILSLTSQKQQVDSLHVLDLVFGIVNFLCWNNENCVDGVLRTNFIPAILDVFSHTTSILNENAARSKLEKEVVVEPSTLVSCSSSTTTTPVTPTTTATTATTTANKTTPIPDIPSSLYTPPTPAILTPPTSLSIISSIVTVHERLFDIFLDSTQLSDNTKFLMSYDNVIKNIMNAISSYEAHIHTLPFTSVTVPLPNVKTALPKTGAGANAKAQVNQMVKVSGVVVAPSSEFIKSGRAGVKLLYNILFDGKKFSGESNPNVYLKKYVEVDGLTILNNYFNSLAKIRTEFVKLAAGAYPSHSVTHPLAISLVNSVPTASDSLIVVSAPPSPHSSSASSSVAQTIYWMVEILNHTCVCLSMMLSEVVPTIEHGRVLSYLYRMRELSNTLWAAKGKKYWNRMNQACLLKAVQEEGRVVPSVVEKNTAKTLTYIPTCVDMLYEYSISDYKKGWEVRYSGDIVQRFLNDLSIDDEIDCLRLLHRGILSELMYITEQCFNEKIQRVEKDINDAEDDTTDPDDYNDYDIYDDKDEKDDTEIDQAVLLAAASTTPATPGDAPRPAVPPPPPKVNNAINDIDPEFLVNPVGQISKRSIYNKVIVHLMTIVNMCTVLSYDEGIRFVEEEMGRIGGHDILMSFFRRTKYIVTYRIKVAIIIANFYSYLPIPNNVRDAIIPVLKNILIRLTFSHTEVNIRLLKRILYAVLALSNRTENITTLSNCNLKYTLLVPLLLHNNPTIARLATDVLSNFTLSMGKEDLEVLVKDPFLAWMPPDASPSVVAEEVRLLNRGINKLRSNDECARRIGLSLNNIISKNVLFAEVVLRSGVVEKFIGFLRFGHEYLSTVLKDLGDPSSSSTTSKETTFPTISIPTSTIPIDPTVSFTSDTIVSATITTVPTTTTAPSQPSQTTSSLQISSNYPRCLLAILSSFTLMSHIHYRLVDILCEHGLIKVVVDVTKRQREIVMREKEKKEKEKREKKEKEKEKVEKEKLESEKKEGEVKENGGKEVEVTTSEEKQGELTNPTEDPVVEGAYSSEVTAMWEPEDLVLLKLVRLLLYISIGGVRIIKEKEEEQKTKEKENAVEKDSLKKEINVVKQQFDESGATGLLFDIFFSSLSPPFPKTSASIPSTSAVDTSLATSSSSVPEKTSLPTSSSSATTLSSSSSSTSSTSSTCVEKPIISIPDAKSSLKEMSCLCLLHLHINQFHVDDSIQTTLSSSSSSSSSSQTLADILSYAGIIKNARPAVWGAECVIDIDDFIINQNNEQNEQNKN
jgi:hypothetical protein